MREALIEIFGAGKIVSKVRFKYSIRASRSSDTETRVLDGCRLIPAPLLVSSASSCRISCSSFSSSWTLIPDVLWPRPRCRAMSSCSLCLVPRSKLRSRGGGGRPTSPRPMRTILGLKDDTRWIACCRYTIQHGYHADIYILKGLYYTENLCCRTKKFDRVDITVPSPTDPG